MNFKKFLNFISRHNAPIIALEIAIFVGIMFAFAAEPGNNEQRTMNSETIEQYSITTEQYVDETVNGESQIVNGESQISNTNTHESETNQHESQISNLEELKIKQVESDKFAFKSLEGDVIEIGTKEHSPPIPYVKLNKWDGEASVSLSFPTDAQKNLQLEGNKVKWIEDKLEVHIYPLGPEEITEIDSQGKEHKSMINSNGGLEWETVLKEKPESNVLSWNIETQGLKFYYQPELTQEEIDEGAFRPENVVGSYAVYHESKSGDYSKMGGKNYKAGKAFHIYRPKVFDAQGNEIWGELNIDEQKGTLTVTIPQDFIDNAVYPVVIDPSFGCSGLGATPGLDIFGYLLADKYQILEDGTAISIWLGLYNDSFDVNQCLGGIYDDVPDSRLDKSNSINVAAEYDSETDGFKECPLTVGASLTKDSYYYLATKSDAGGLTLYYDSTGGVTAYRETTNFELPAAYGDSSALGYRMSIYCTYVSYNFGNVVEGDSTDDDFLGAIFHSSKFTTTAEQAGVIESFSYYGTGISNNRLLLYTYDDLTLRDYTAQFSGDNVLGLHQHDATQGYTLVPSTTYLIGIHDTGVDSGSIKYNAGDANQGVYDTDYSDLESPIEEDFNTNYKYSIYCTYTPAEEEYQPRPGGVGISGGAFLSF